MPYRGYEASIAKIVDPAKYPPDVVEGWMRITHRTLDHLDRSTFAREARLAARCIDEVGLEEARRLAI